MLPKFIGPVILCSIFLITGCDQQKKQYEQYLKNPEQLKQVIASCQQHKTASLTCLHADFAQQIIQSFSDLVETQSTNFLVAKDQLTQLQHQWDQSGHLPELKQSLQAQQDKVMQSMMALQFSVEENFAKLIMQQEVHLVYLQKKQTDLKIALKNKSINAQVVKTQLYQLKKMIRYTQEKIKAMLTFVALSTQSGE